MAHSLSAKKRMRQNAKRRIRNRARTSQLKTAIKKLLALIHDRKAEEAARQFRAVSGLLDRSADHGTIHPNKAARTKSRLSARLKGLEAKPAAAPA